MMPDELHALTRPRRLVTHELYPFNAFYGHAQLLKRYADLDPRTPLKAAIEHGPTFFPNPLDPDLFTRLPRYFCAAPARARFYEEHAVHAVQATAIGPLVRYADALAEPVAPTGRRLVFFDAHSSDYLVAAYDVDAVIDRLLKFRSDFDEVAVCLYWRDILLGRAEPYLRRGIECVSAGHMFDEQFLFRLVEIIRSATVVFTDRVGSHLLYALALDRPVWLEYAPAAYAQTADSPYEGTAGAPQDTEVVDVARELFAAKVEQITAEQHEFAEEWTGLSSFRSPAEINSLIAEAETAFRAEVHAAHRARLRATAAARRLWNARP
jgi:hypothetical protein